MNTFEYFFWTLSIYMAISLQDDPSPRKFIWLGVVMGIALLNKISAGWLIERKGFHRIIPLLEQLAQRRQMSKLQNQVQQIGRDTSSRQLDESIRPTGHRATYLNYSHFYQQAR